MKFEHVSIFNGIGFKKKLKAPTDHCFVLKVCTMYGYNCRHYSQFKIHFHGGSLVSNFNAAERNEGTCYSEDDATVATRQSF